MTAAFNHKKEHLVRDGNDSGSVSVIVPARNEEQNIERAVRSIATQKGVREIIVVDDDSNDRTSEILATLGQEIPLLRVIRLDYLPEGWVGKNHASAAGAATAKGEWLLFTDADTEHLPGSLEALLSRARAENTDLLSLSPGQQTPTWWEKAIIPFVFVQLAKLFPFEEVSDPASPRAAANGQYLLVRRSVYNRVGGHREVRGEILDDVELARLVKTSGGKLVFLPGARWVRTRMYGTFREMWQGWSKNLYLLYGRKRWPMLKALARTLILGVFLPLAFVAFAALAAARVGGRTTPIAAVLCFASAILRQWNYHRELRRLGFDSRLSAYEFLGSGLYGLLLLNSMWAYGVAGGVRWKGRKYQASGQGRRTG
ncbi:MAG: glycosyltransferase family 2 protein [Acidobacteria bacterium]|nr:glycosyltransferase family 2 protein [Acidobacteriota bacterium]